MAIYSNFSINNSGWVGRTEEGDGGKKEEARGGRGRFTRTFLGEGGGGVNHVKCSIIGDEIAPCSCPQGTTYQTLQTHGGEFVLSPAHFVQYRQIILHIFKGEAKY